VLIWAEDYGVLLVRSREAMTWRGSGGQSWWGLACLQVEDDLDGASAQPSHIGRLLPSNGALACHGRCSRVRDKEARVCAIGGMEHVSVKDTQDWRC
jgi:hypothetical protein